MLTLGLKTLNFKDTSEINNYTASIDYGVIKEKICFGVSLEEINTSYYNYSLHFFDAADMDSNGYQDIPNQLLSSIDKFQYGPDLKSFKKWGQSGFLELMVIINNVINSMISGNNNTMQLNTAISAIKYDSYKVDQFSQIIGFMLPFFLIIAYVCPLVIIVFRIVSDKVKTILNKGN